MGTRAALGTDGGSRTADFTATGLQGLRQEERFSRVSEGGNALRIIGQFLTGLPVAAWMLVDVAVLCAGLKFGYVHFVPPAYVPDLNIDVVSAAAI